MNMPYSVPETDAERVCNGCWTRGFCEDRIRMVQKCRCRCVEDGWHHTDYLMRTELDNA